jgi:hypothetical protein
MTKLKITPQEESYVEVLPVTKSLDYETEYVEVTIEWPDQEPFQKVVPTYSVHVLSQIDGTETIVEKEFKRSLMMLINPQKVKRNPFVQLAAPEKSSYAKTELPFGMPNYLFALDTADPYAQFNETPETQHYREKQALVSKKPIYALKWTALTDEQKREVLAEARLDLYQPEDRELTKIIIKDKQKQVLGWKQVQMNLKELFKKQDHLLKYCDSLETSIMKPADKEKLQTCIQNFLVNCWNGQLNSLGSRSLLRKGAQKTTSSAFGPIEYPEIRKTERELRWTDRKRSLSWEQKKAWQNYEWCYYKVPIQEGLYVKDLLFELQWPLFQAFLSTLTVTLPKETTYQENQYSQLMDYYGGVLGWPAALAPFSPLLKMLVNARITQPFAKQLVDTLFTAHLPDTRSGYLKELAQLLLPLNLSKKVLTSLLGTWPTKTICGTNTVENFPFKCSGTMTRGVYNQEVLQQTKQAYTQSWYQCLSTIHKNPPLYLDASLFTKIWEEEGQETYVALKRAFNPGVGAYGFREARSRTNPYTISSRQEKREVDFSYKAYTLAKNRYYVQKRKLLLHELKGMLFEWDMPMNTGQMELSHIPMDPEIQVPVEMSMDEAILKLLKPKRKTRRAYAWKSFRKSQFLKLWVEKLLDRKDMAYVMKASMYKQCMFFINDLFTKNCDTDNLKERAPELKERFYTLTAQMNDKTGTKSDKDTLPAFFYAIKKKRHFIKTYTGSFRTTSTSTLNYDLFCQAIIPSSILKSSVLHVDSPAYKELIEKRQKVKKAFTWTYSEMRQGETEELIQPWFVPEEGEVNPPLEWVDTHKGSPVQYNWIPPQREYDFQSMWLGQGWEERLTVLKTERCQSKLRVNVNKLYQTFVSSYQTFVSKVSTHLDSKVLIQSCKDNPNAEQFLSRMIRKGGFHISLETEEGLALVEEHKALLEYLRRGKQLYKQLSKDPNVEPHEKNQLMLGYSYYGCFLYSLRPLLEKTMVQAYYERIPENSLNQTFLWDIPSTATRYQDYTWNWDWVSSIYGWPREIFLLTQQYSDFLDSIKELKGNAWLKKQERLGFILGFLEKTTDLGLSTPLAQTLETTLEHTLDHRQSTYLKPSGLKKKDSKEVYGSYKIIPIPDWIIYHTNEKVSLENSSIPESPFGIKWPYWFQDLSTLGKIKKDGSKEDLFFVDKTNLTTCDKWAYEEWKRSIKKSDLLGEFLDQQRATLRRQHHENPKYDMQQSFLELLYSVDKQP